MLDSEQGLDRSLFRLGTMTKMSHKTLEMFVRFLNIISLKTSFLLLFCRLKYSLATELFRLHVEAEMLRLLL